MILGYELMIDTRERRGLKELKRENDRVAQEYQISRETSCHAHGVVLRIKSRREH
jgi:hypothetical protein